MPGTVLLAIVVSGDEGPHTKCEGHQWRKHKGRKGQEQNKRAPHMPARKRLGRKDQDEHGKNLR